VPIDYGFATVRTPAAPGPIESVHVPFDAVVPPATVRAYVMVDAYPAVRRTLVVP
jgi:hypothetical protein